MELVDKILEVINKIGFLDRRRIVIHNDLKLYPSEIHLLLFVYYIQDKNITKIANKMGLTKGAVSQTFLRLYNKGIIKKEIDPFKKNEAQIHFTSKGTRLMNHLIEIKKYVENEYLTYIKMLSEKDKNVISDFLDKIVSIMNSQHQLN
ncbi:MAG: MarR family transcriptional regulator [Candidatus Odinarchaeota archaeon]